MNFACYVSTYILSTLRAKNSMVTDMLCIHKNSKPAILSDSLVHMVDMLVASTSRHFHSLHVDATYEHVGRIQFAVLVSLYYIRSFIPLSVTS